MYYNMDWAVELGKYSLRLMAGCEIHKSVDILAATCTITLPGFAYNKAFEVEDKLKRGDKVVVKLGYTEAMNKPKEEFTGYLLSVSTDGGSLTLNCEDELFTLRKNVNDKQFLKTTTKQLAQYLLSETKSQLKLNVTLTIDYDKFVISKATAYDVLKKLKEETKANIFIKDGTLHIHPPYSEEFELVQYSFQQNIEKDDLQYIRAEDKKVEVIVSTTGKDGNKKEVRYGTSGGEKIEIDGSGMSEAGMRKRAELEHDLHVLDGYEGSITTWLIPSIRPGDTAKVKDADYPYKDGRYYVTAVTTTFGESGASRKVQLGKKLA